MFTLAHGCLRVWDLSGDAARRIAQYKHVYEAEFESRDVLIMNNEDGTVTAESFGDGRTLRRTILSDQFKDKGRCLISISPRFVMIADQEENLLCWGRRTMRLQQNCVLDGYVPLRGCISPDGKRAVSVAWENSVSVIKTQPHDNFTPVQINLKCRSPVRKVIWSPDGIRVAVITDECLELWNTQDLDGTTLSIRDCGPRPRLSPYKHNSHAAFSPDGSYIAVCNIYEEGLQLLKITDAALEEVYRRDEKMTYVNWFFGRFVVVDTKFSFIIHDVGKEVKRGL